MRMPNLTPLHDGYNWIFNDEYIYSLNDGRVVYIISGFKTDFTSSPRIFWRYVPPASGKHRLASLVHDWLVASEATTWKDAADIMLQIMARSGVGEIKRNLIYYAVRGFGAFHKPDPRRDKLREIQQASPKYIELTDSYVVL